MKTVPVMIVRIKSNSIVLFLLALCSCSDKAQVLSGVDYDSKAVISLSDDAAAILLPNGLSYIVGKSEGNKYLFEFERLSFEILGIDEGEVLTCSIKEDRIGCYNRDLRVLDFNMVATPLDLQPIQITNTTSKQTCSLYDPLYKKTIYLSLLLDFSTFVASQSHTSEYSLQIVMESGERKVYTCNYLPRELLDECFANQWQVEQIR